MPATTPNRLYPYPLGPDPIDTAGDIERLAKAIDLDSNGLHNDINTINAEFVARGILDIKFVASNIGPYTWGGAHAEVHPALYINLPAHPGGRWLRFSAYVPMFSANVTYTFVDIGIQCSKNGGPWELQNTQRMVNGGSLIVASPGGTATLLTDPPAANYQYRMTAWQVSPGNAYLTLAGSSELPIYFTVEDLGPR